MYAKQGFTGVVLAGGRSTRMGRDKFALIRINESMLQFTQQQLSRAGAQQVIVSRGFESRDTEGQNPDNELADCYQDLGPLGGIHTILQHRPGEHLLFVPVDLPFLNPAALHRLAQVGLAGKQSVSYFRQPLPFFFYWRDTHQQRLAQIIEAKRNLSIRHFANAIQTLKLNTQAQDDWFNANTPQDWQRVLQRL